jgi:uncharacterized protein (TIGR03435 family)
VRIWLLIELCLSLGLARSAFGQENTNHQAGPVKLTQSTNQSEYGEYGVTTTDDYISIERKTLYEIIQCIYPGSIPVIDEANLPNIKYDLKIPGTNANNEDYWKALEPMLRQSFSLTAGKEKRVIEIYEMRVKVNPPPGLKLSLPTDERTKYTTNAASFRLQYIRYTMDDLEGDLDQVMSLPVYDETGLTNDYNFALDGFALTDPQIAAQSLKDLGLSLDKVKKEKDVLVIRKVHLDLLTVPK